MEDGIHFHRRLLKSHPDLWKRFGEIDTPAKRGEPKPEAQKSCSPGAEMIDLTPRVEFRIGQIPLLSALSARRTRRSFTDEALSFEELSFLLWAAEGVNREPDDAGVARRTAPTGGSMYPIETYIVVHERRIDGVEAGLYRYLPLNHKLCVLELGATIWDRVMECIVSKWADGSAVLLIWSAIPSRLEWKFSILCHKAIVMEAGHSCQNVYLACEAIGAGTGGIGAYYQEEIDAAIGLDGEEEFVVYIAPIGKVDSS